MDKNKKIAGVSLVELMIAMVLIAMALVAIVGIFPRISGHRRNITEADQARIIAMEVLEGVQRFVVAHPLPTGADPMFNSTCPMLVADANIASDNSHAIAHFIRRVNTRWSTGSPVTYTAEVTRVIPNSCATDLNTAEVTVTWTKQGRPSSLTVTGAIR
jgi:Tfp pilus assembly protein PilV